MTRSLPDLSRFEMTCLRRLWSLGEASVREVHAALPDPPSYSTVRKIFERLEEKGAVKRVRLDGKAWRYRSTVSASGMIRKEIRRFLDTLFDGAAGPLMAHLADMDAVSLDDLREIESRLEEPARPAPSRSTSRRGTSARGASTRGAASGSRSRGDASTRTKSGGEEGA